MGCYADDFHLLDMSYWWSIHTQPGCQHDSVMAQNSSHNYCFMLFVAGNVVSGVLLSVMLVVVVGLTVVSVVVVGIAEAVVVVSGVGFVVFEILLV